MNPGDSVILRLVKTHGTEIICDQEGHPLDGVVDFKYEVLNDGGAELIVRVRCPKVPWDPILGMRSLSPKN